MKGIHHFGIATNNHHKYVTMLSKKGFKFFKEGICPAYSTYCMFLKKGDDMIELCVGLNENSPITKYLKKHKEGLHHLALNKKFKGGVKGALPGMRVKFNLENNILSEEVDFDE